MPKGASGTGGRHRPGGVKLAASIWTALCPMSWASQDTVISPRVPTVNSGHSASTSVEESCTGTCQSASAARVATSRVCAWPVPGRELDSRMIASPRASTAAPRGPVARPGTPNCSGACQPPPTDPAAASVTWLAGSLWLDLDQATTTLPEAPIATIGRRPSTPGGESRAGALQAPPAGRRAATTVHLFSDTGDCSHVTASSPRALLTSLTSPGSTPGPEIRTAGCQAPPAARSWAIRNPEAVSLQT